jgi:ornithine cyclodeaminase/alanine dehydrogenase-like protein (mu-crystallin family)
MLVLYANDVKGSISMKDAISAIELAFRDWGNNEGLNAPRRRIHAPSGVRVSVHQGAAPSLGMTGFFQHTELVRAFGDRQEQVHRAHPMHILLDSETGELKCMIIGEVTCSELPECYASTGIRTAATSVLGTKYLARENATSVGIFGGGRQARQHLVGLTEIRKLTLVKVYRRNAEENKWFAKEMAQKLDIEVIPCESPRDVCRGVDIIMALTNSSVPVFDGSWLEPGQHVTSIVGSNVGLVTGGFTPKKRREIDDITLHRADILVVTSRQQAIQDEQGDLFEPVKAGIVSWESMIDLADLVAGKMPGRSSDEQITVFKNNAGQGIADVAIGSKVYSYARQKRLGTELEVGLPTYFDK